MKTLLRLTLSIGYATLSTHLAWAQPKAALNQSGTRATTVTQPARLALTKEQMSLMANGQSVNQDDELFLLSGITFQKKDPLGKMLKDDESAAPATYGVGFKTWVIFDEYMMRMATCIDKCEAFWAAYPKCEGLTTQKQVTAALGYGENSAQAGLDIIKASPDLFTTFMFYDGYAKYYFQMNYVPLRKYAGRVEFRVSWLAMDPYDIYTAILQNNLSIIEAREGSGMNRGANRRTTTFTPAKQ